MTRRSFGATAADFLLDGRGNAVDGTGTVWTAQVGGSQLFDVVDANGGTGGSVNTSATVKGMVQFQGPPDGTAVVWVDFGGGRVKLVASDGFWSLGDTQVDAAGYATLQAAHDDAPAGGILNLRRGDYADQTLNITKRLRVVGAGSGNDGTSNGNTRITSTSGTGDAVTVAAAGVSLEGLRIVNGASSVTGGAGVKVTSGDYLKMNDVAVSGFWINLDIVSGIAWALRNSNVANSGKYGMRINNSVADGGDQVISDCLFTASSGTRQPDALIRYESGGGLKMTNSKLQGGAAGANQNDYGIDMAWGVGPSGVLLISNVSIENVAIDTVRLDAGNQGFTHAAFSNMELGLLSNTTGSGFNITKSGSAAFQFLSLNNITVQQTGGASTGYAVKANGVANLAIGVLNQAANIGRTSLTACTNVTDPGLSSVSHTVAGLPSASAYRAGTTTFCSNETGGAVTVFTDGTNWRRVTDRAVAA